jgi:hypothetical protein
MPWAASTAAPIWAVVIGSGARPQHVQRLPVQGAALEPLVRLAALHRDGPQAVLQGWNRPFDEPIPLSRGRQLVTLKDAANYIQKLPKAEQDLEEWQAAVEAMLLVVELNGPTMMARIGVLKALNRHVRRELNPSTSA